MISCSDIKFLLFKDSEQYSEELIAKCYHCFSVLHSLLSFFVVIFFKFGVIFHYPHSHKVNSSSERFRSFLGNSSSCVNAGSGLSDSRIGSGKSNEFFSCIKTRNISGFSNKMRSCDLADTFYGSEYLQLSAVVFFNFLDKTFCKLIQSFKKKRSVSTSCLITVSIILEL